MSGKSYGFIITALSRTEKDPAALLKTAQAIAKEGRRVTIFLIGDGVYLAMSGQTNQASVALADAIEAGVEVLVGQEHLKASGIKEGNLMTGSKVIDRSYKNLALMVMEKWDRVVVC